MSAASEPILIYRLGSLGDTVVALPCFHAIARAFPGHRKLVLTNVPVSSKAAALDIILRPGGLIDEVIEYPVGQRSLGAFWQLRRAIRATGARTMIYLAAPRGRRAVLRDTLFFRLCGFSKIIGVPLDPDLHDCRETDTGMEPEAERLARTMAALGPIDLQDPANWDLRFTEAERARATAALAPLGGRAFIGINMGGKDASKDWGDDNWQALITDLALRHGTLGLVAVGANEDAERSAAVLACWPGPTANLCGALSPRESGAALGGAQLFIGHDSGPLHLAAAGGARVIGLFGNFNRPRRWHPYGPQHRVHHDMRGVRAITVGEVAATIESMLPATVA
jgi:heptosyltransferase III